MKERNEIEKRHHKFWDLNFIILNSWTKSFESKLGSKPFSNQAFTDSAFLGFCMYFDDVFCMYIFVQTRRHDEEQIL